VAAVETAVSTACDRVIALLTTPRSGSP